MVAIGHYAPMSRMPRVAWIVAVTAALALGAGIGGYALRGAVDADDGYDGHMVYGDVSDLRNAKTVCITAEATICAQLLNGEMPSLGSPVRGWLVTVPATDDSSLAKAKYWAFVTTMAG